jgi:hypothetical protein
VTRIGGRRRGPADVPHPSAEVAAELAELRAAVQRLEGELAGQGARLQQELARVAGLIQLVYDEEPARRRQLRQLRASEAYELAFSDPEPLVSIPIPTYDAYELLGERALPSVLAQTYRNIEVIVVGEASPPETEQVVAAFADPRISYVRLNRRGPYPDDPSQAWMSAGTVPFNEAVARARGHWIAPLDDDYAFTPDHVERLLAAARAGRYELCFGRIRQRHPDGSSRELGVFPPEFSQFGVQASIYHAGLRFFELELADALFGLPNDWGLCRRMLRAGVRVGMVDATVVDYYPSMLWKPSPGQAP